MIIQTKDAYLHALPPKVHCVHSTSASKMYRYGQEPYYQESSHSLSIDLNGDLADYGRFTFILLKPDAFVARAGRRILAALERRGFKVRGSLHFSFNRFMWRELWRYELNIARVERYPLIDDLLCGERSLFVLLEDVTGAADGSARLTAQKGNSDTCLRDGASLRAEIGAQTGTLNFMHCPDEFIDFIREVGVLFDRSQRAAVASLMDGSRSNQVRSDIDFIESFYPEHPLALDVLRSELGAEFTAALKESENRLRHSPYTLRDSFCTRFALSRWDWITIAATFLVFSYAGMPRVLEFEVGI